jgi:hypothetical protein
MDQERLKRRRLYGRNGIDVRMIRRMRRIRI